MVATPEELMTGEIELNARLIQEKYEAARARGFYRTGDLFSGCGGLTLGFDRAGYRCITSLEINDDARRSHELNFLPRARGAYRAYADITQTEPEAAVAHIEGLDPERCVDIIIGGGPCQAFSRLGRAALWKLAKKKYAHYDDPRAHLYEFYLKYLASLLPLAFVMENVREIGKFSQKNVAHEIAETAEQLGYTTRYAILNSVWFGVPQLRERLIIIGIHKSLDLEPQFPVIKHEYDLPVGYSTSRAGTGRADVLPPHDYYVDHYDIEDRLESCITARMAFEDLPVITHHLDGRCGRGRPRNTEEELEYRADVSNAYIREMREWPGFESGGNSSSGHVIRYTPRDYETFRRMPHGGEYPDAVQTAEQIFLERLRQEGERRGRRINRNSRLWLEIRRNTVPPYRVDHFPNKFRKMWPDEPARTVPAHLGKDSYSHIHFDNEQARCISLREAARLQSFPDAFRFAGGMNSQLTQIGNAVPPLLSHAIASTLKQTLDRALQQTNLVIASGRLPIQQSLRW
jgi:DNA (cytosine-5)-methyltransferase 1